MKKHPARKKKVKKQPNVKVVKLERNTIVKVEVPKGLEPVVKDDQEKREVYIIPVVAKKKNWWQRLFE